VCLRVYSVAGIGRHWTVCLRGIIQTVYLLLATKTMTALWKVACQEAVYPGMWQRWFKNQCVAVGWAAQWGYRLNGLSDS
jgi:hypothetical protein